MALIETTMFKVHKILNMNMVHESIEETINQTILPWIHYKVSRDSIRNPSL